MRVQFTQSGGFMGAVRGCEVDSASLGPEAAQELEKLVEASGLTQSAQHLSPDARDLHQYEITIDDGKQPISVVLDDSTVPATARSLLAFLKSNARPKPLA